MRPSVVSWTPATRARSARRLVMRIGYRSLRRSANGRILWMCGVGAQHGAPLPSATFPRGHCETAPLSPHDERGGRGWHARARSRWTREKTRPHRARDLRGPSRDGAGSRAHARGGARHRLHRRRAALVVQSLRAHAAAGRGDAQERRAARAVVPHVRRHDLRRLGAQPREGQDPRPTVPLRARFRGLDQADARRLAGMGGSLQCRRRGGPQGGPLARVPQRGISPEADRRPDPLRRLHQSPRSLRHSPAARRRKHADRRRRPDAVSPEVSRPLLELPPQGRGGRPFSRHGAREGDLRFQEVPGRRACLGAEACPRRAGTRERRGRRPRARARQLRVSARPRVLMRLTALVVAAAIAGATLSAQHGTARVPAKHYTYVIVHGAWGGGWDWRAIDSMLTRHGHRVVRVTLTGLGERHHLASPNIGLDTHIDDVVNTILWDNLHDVVLLGHSYGGMVITGVVDRIPDRIKRVVYLDALLPDSGESVMSIPDTARQKFVQSVTRDGYLVPVWVQDTTVIPRDVPQSLRTFTDTLRLVNPARRNVASAYILTYEPQITPDPFQPFADRAAARGWPVYKMVSDHLPERNHRAELVALLERIP